VEVVSYGRPLRQWAENLLLGTAGSDRTIAAGRFHLESPDAPAFDGPPTHSAERAVKVTVRPGSPNVPVNTLDNLVLRDHALTVRITYALTHAGGNLAESVDEQGGAGTLEAVEDRAGTDQHDVEAVLMWGPNAAGTDPVIVNVTPGAPTFEAEDDRAVLTLPYTLLVLATVPGSYAP
jgi:hypothetical protein